MDPALLQVIFSGISALAPMVVTWIHQAKNSDGTVSTSAVVITQLDSTDANYNKNLAQVQQFLAAHGVPQPATKSAGQ